MGKSKIVSVFILVGIVTVGYFNWWNESVAKIDELVGQSYDFACEKYFKALPDSQYLVNINRPLNEFDGGIVSKRGMLSDSIVHVYTWNYRNYKKTTWVGVVDDTTRIIIDALMYRRDVQF